ncbi:cytidylate kinase [Pullulanibacillus pueri]|uniref:Tunicamycin resistance protein n=1 Tax=Pullulanibacillus pueri TaxID=1437324 RepID=A0A8J2ZU46_9BACL|nr:AAA family ATPase [Pullulanibacillus pueri]MBM7681261.1 cytidylate kinase [Pullulanibacillus pueri]GGH77843.1 tunicamycin resistance protein [Pullulanibacillus pueri]
MIIWINGTFGAGKTTTAYELHRRIKDAFVYDPERFGYVFMRNVPKEIAKSDFQDYPLWREANYKLLKQVAEDYKGVIIAPMTLTHEVYFEEMIGRLRDQGFEVNHFTLLASTQTIEKRLRKRWEGKKSWAYQQMKERLDCLSRPLFQEHIQTDNLSIDEVVETIAERIGIQLEPDNRSRVKKIIDRTGVSIKEIAWFK